MSIPEDEYITALDEEREAGYEKGYEDGYEEGRTEAEGRREAWERKAYEAGEETTLRLIRKELESALVGLQREIDFHNNVANLFTAQDAFDFIEREILDI